MKTSDKPSWIAPIESRRGRADYYFQAVLENQRDWYSAKAGTQKIRQLFFAISVIILGLSLSTLTFWRVFYISQKKVEAHQPKILMIGLLIGKGIIQTVSPKILL